MNTRSIRELLHKEPFDPLVFLFTDGSEELVRHPENVLLTPDTIAFARWETALDVDGWMKTYSTLQLVSVTPRETR